MADFLGLLTGFFNCVGLSEMLTSPSKKNRVNVFPSRGAGSTLPYRPKNGVYALYIGSKNGKTLQRNSAISWIFFVLFSFYSAPFAYDGELRLGDIFQLFPKYAFSI